MKSHKLNRSLTFLTLLTVAFTVAADVTMPSVLGSGMVLQRDLPVPIWGWDEPGTEVTVSFKVEASASIEIVTFVTDRRGNPIVMGGRPLISGNNELVQAPSIQKHTAKAGEDGRWQEK